MPSDVLEVTQRFMREPVRILVKKEELTLEGIRQFYVQVEREVSSQGGVWLIWGEGLSEWIVFAFNNFG